MLDSDTMVKSMFHGINSYVTAISIVVNLLSRLMKIILLHGIVWERERGLTLVKELELWSKN
jgi:hypothetical protein